jgi:RNase P protein component
MLQNPANLLPKIDLVVVASVKCQKADHATLGNDLTQLMGEAQKWVGGLESS